MYSKYETIISGAFGTIIKCCSCELHHSSYDNFRENDPCVSRAPGYLSGAQAVSGGAAGASGTPVPAESVEHYPGAVKHDAGKPDLSLISADFIEELGKVLSHGASKYAAHNWRKGFNWTRVVGAVFRHVWAWSGGEDKDPDSGLSHLGHAACGIMFLVEFQRRGKGTDDRFKY